MIQIPDRLAPMQPINLGTIEGTNVPLNSLPVVMRNNSQLARKPVSPPPHPQIATPLAGISLGFQFAYNQLVSPTVYGNQIDSYRIYRNTSANAFSGAMLIRTIRHDPTHLGAVTVQDSVVGGKQYYYFITAVDTFGQESTTPGSFQSSAITSGNANPNVSNAVGTTSAPGSTSTTYVVVPEMTVTVTTKGNKVLINFSGSFFLSNSPSTSPTMSFAAFRDGSQVSGDIIEIVATTDELRSKGMAITYIDNPTPGSHTFDIRWKVAGDAGAQVNGDHTNRSLQIVELG